MTVSRALAPRYQSTPIMIAGVLRLSVMMLAAVWSWSAQPWLIRADGCARRRLRRPRSSWGGWSRRPIRAPATAPR